MILLASSYKRKLNNRKQLVLFYLGRFACVSDWNREKCMETNTFFFLFSFVTICSLCFTVLLLPSTDGVRALSLFFSSSKVLVLFVFNSHTNTNAQTIRDVMRYMSWTSRLKSILRVECKTEFWCAFFSLLLALFFSSFFEFNTFTQGDKNVYAYKKKCCLPQYINSYNI